MNAPAPSHFTRPRKTLTTMKFLCLIAALAGSISIVNAEPDPQRDTAEAKAVAQLSAAYAKMDGYTATYHSVSEGKSVDCTLGMDHPSGLGFVRVAATKGDQTMDMRQWATPADRVYFSAGGKTMMVKGLNEELASLRELANVITGKPADGGPMQFTPEILLEKSVFIAGIGMTTTVMPPWFSFVEDASIQASDDKSITFLTKEDGSLTISRENGMLVRQSLPVEGGEPRVMELKELQLNPGKEAITKISADWSVADAEKKPVIAWMKPIRLLYFQSIIDSAEQGKVGKDKLDEVLEEQYEVLRNFAKACLNEREGPFATKADWPELFAKAKTVGRKKWLEDTPGADASNEKGFLEFLQSPEFRLQVRNSVVEGILTPEEAPETIMDDIFGRGGWASLKVGNDLGVGAKKSLVNALSRAYLEALVDLKMAKQWDQRDGLD